MNWTDAPPETWLLALEYILYIINRMAFKPLNWRTPFEALKGYTPDISMIYRFRFWDKVVFQIHESRGAIKPSEEEETSEETPIESNNTNEKETHHENIGNEGFGRFVGFAETVGHPLTYKVLTDDTRKIIYRSRIKFYGSQQYRKVDETMNNMSEEDSENEEEKQARKERMAVIDISDIIGKTYLSTPEEDGSRTRLKIVERINELEKDIANNPNIIKFRAENDDQTMEEIIDYNQLLQRLEEDDGEQLVWKFKSIKNHEGPLTPGHHKYRGSKWNIQIEWENGEVTWEPLSIIAASDPVTCAIYAKDNNLLKHDGWKRFSRLAKRQKKMLRMANQAKLKSYRTAPVYKYGVEIPRNHEHAMELDKKNGNNLWRDAEIEEINLIDEYNTFTDKGKGHQPIGHKKIKVRMVYDCKASLKRRGRLVAAGYLVPTPIEGVYSSVVSLRGLKCVLFIGELNNMQIYATDIGSAYLQSFTKEKCFIIAGPEFGEREGHTLIVTKAIYGLKSSGVCWWERFSDILLSMGFTPSKAEDDIWMRKKGELYEYIARYVDDLIIISNNNKEIYDMLVKENDLKLKDWGPIKFYLGCDFYRDDHGTLCMAPKKYIERMSSIYERHFGEKPKQKYTSPLEKGDHPELDTTEELEINDIKIYQSLIGAAQWLVSLGRFDIQTAVMTLSSFRANPRKGHMDRIKRVFCYITKMKHGALRFRTELPDYSDIPESVYDWEKSIYGKVEECIPHDIPKPLGKPVIFTAYEDANLMHDITTGKSVTGNIHLVNKTIIDTYSKKQPVVQTATYGSEFMAARTTVEQIIDLRTTFRYLGVKVLGPTHMFGDNQSVVQTCDVSKGRMHKRHNLLSFH